MTGGPAAPPPNPPPQPHTDPPPSYSTPQPATLTPTTFTEHQHPQSSHSHVPLAGPVTNEAPPDYFLHDPGKEGPPLGKAGLAVQIQMDGRLVPGTVMEDVS